METVAYFYPRDKSGERLGHSICVLIVDNKPFVGFANLSAKDKFNRKIGRNIAESRAREQYVRYQAAKNRNADELPKTTTELREGVKKVY